MINSYVIDRRLNGKNKSAVNRRRFLERYRRHVKAAVNDAVNKRSITDMEKGESISIPSKDLHEPVVGHGQGGNREMVHPGNKEFVEGDRIRKPQSGQGKGKGNQASKDGEGLDDFTFYISQDEFLEFLFDDLALPNMVRKDLKKSQEFERHRAGYSTEGVPANINVVRSLKNAHARRIALGGKKRRRVREIEEQLARMKGTSETTERKRSKLEAEMAELKLKLRKLPFIDDFDLRYNRHEKHPVPSSAAVMFCLMDVSGSMTQNTKDIAKRFFLLLYLFLRRNYQTIEVVFIRHHTSAKEVDEEEFFYSRETGGTIVSSALRLMQDIMKERYPTSAWNVYAAQASDGDNWGDDSPICRDLLMNEIMPKVNYYSYIEISPRDHQDLWYAYEDVKAAHEEGFAMAQILDQSEIYPVFRELFQRREA
ncbi:MAG: YeaH/YhbH family protein [Natronospirillum sp.]|uniref:YeaH/YhbH family protein n=1 Tax=Natronospirillum sp. TaxID=2812955 RepID=UPI0025D965B7|nr:YeaH/YhbH family protein [Natronospirillum sp.]MCH8551105.1 YeaH/YhbH family protein [Natronospirillum sp.]